MKSSAHARAAFSGIVREALVVLSALCVPLSLRAQDPATAAAATITSADVLRRIGIIADDSMRGRDTPSPGLEKTAAYIASQFRSFGLQPAGDSGTFIQRYPYRTRRLDVHAQMIGMTNGPLMPLSFGADFFAVPSDEDGIDAPAYYAGVVTPQFTLPAAARNHVIVAAIPDTMSEAWGRNVNVLLLAAMGAGARAVIIALDPAVTSESLAANAGPISEQAAPLMIFGVRVAALMPLLRAMHVDTAGMFSYATSAGRADAPPVSLHLSTPAAMLDVRPPNVVAMLRGSDSILRDQYVVFSAHMDHVGIGAPDSRGDTIYNGADDDGSGTTAIMEVAQAFASMKTPPARSILFVTFSGEEKGLLGSDFFTAHTPVPASHIVADFNIDMIGRNNPDSVTAIGVDYTSLGTSARAAAAAHPELHLVVAPDLTPEEHLFERSDHFNFAKKNIPAIFFTSGLHADYHRPSDEVSRIDTDKLARVARLVFFLGNGVATAADRPTWTKAGLDVVKGSGGGR